MQNPAEIIRQDFVIISREANITATAITLLSEAW